MRRVIVMLVGLLVAGAAQAQPATDVPSLPAVTDIQWDMRPTLQADDYPALALMFEMEGAATLRCVGVADGSVRHCEVIEEDGQVGFGESAIRVVERGRVHPHTIEGVAQNATFTVRIPFLLGDGETEDRGAPPAYSGEEPSAELVALVRAYVEEWMIAGLIVEDMIGPLSAQDRARVEIHFVRAVRDKHALLVDAMALGLARIAPPEVVAALEAGLPPPPATMRPDFTAMDQVFLAQAQILARAREYFCAQHSCPDED